MNEINMHQRGTRLDAAVDTLPGLLGHWAKTIPDKLWLTETVNETRREWSWARAAGEVFAISTWLEGRIGHGKKIAILSRNRAHWMLADLAIMASGNVTVPIFTTQTPELTRYILDFADVELLFLGEADNWQNVRNSVPANITVVCFPDLVLEDGAFEDRALEDRMLKWSDILASNSGQVPSYVSHPDDLATIVFTSGTTGHPKGVMHTHHTLISPMERSTAALKVEHFDRFMSYLPLSHLAEREQIFAMSLVCAGTVNFMESRSTMLRDMRATRPSFFFGAPRIWEQLQQVVFQSFGGVDPYQAAYHLDSETTAGKARDLLGLGETKSLLSGSAPISRALLQFYLDIGLTIIEGFGQTEAMGLTCTTRDMMRLGSIGKPVEGTEAKISQDGELLVKTADAAIGYYKNAEATSTTFIDGWVHTGDKARVDEDGFYFITGRMKDYFKTIHGKFVAPVPIEDAFAKIPHIDQRCLLGRGYSKTVMVATLTPGIGLESRQALSKAITGHVDIINKSVEKHARIGAVILSGGEWLIENGFLTTTLKLKRDRVEATFGELAQALALEAAQQGKTLIRFAD